VFITPCRLTQDCELIAILQCSPITFSSTVLWSPGFPDYYSITAEMEATAQETARSILSISTSPPPTIHLTRSTPSHRNALLPERICSRFRFQTFSLRYYSRSPSIYNLFGPFTIHVHADGFQPYASHGTGVLSKKVTLISPAHAGFCAQTPGLNIPS